MAREVSPEEYGEVSPATGAPSSGLAPREVSQADFSDPLPSYASGLSPQVPINKSPLEIEDRFALSLGNTAGNISKLKQKFEAVEQTPEGDLLVRKGGLWHRVDGKTGEAPDAWSATKSIAKGFMAATQTMANKFAPRGLLPKQDLAVQGLTRGDELAKETASEVVESLPTVGAVGLGYAAGLITGGASIPLQAGIAGLAGGMSGLGRTSWGRLEGTYEASPEEQAVDIGVESALNVLGVLIPLGVKPSGKYIGEQLMKTSRGRWVYNQAGKATEWISERGNATTDGVKQLYSFVTGRNPDAVDTLFAHQKAVGKVMKEVGEEFRNPAAFEDHLTRKMVGHVKEIAEAASELPSEVYRKQQAKLIAGVSDSFAGNMDDVVDGVLKEAMDTGMVSIKATDRYLARGNDVIKTKVGQILSKADALELLANNKGNSRHTLC